MHYSHLCKPQRVPWPPSELCEFILFMGEKEGGDAIDDNIIVSGNKSNIATIDNYCLLILTFPFRSALDHHPP